MRQTIHPSPKPPIFCDRGLMVNQNLSGLPIGIRVDHTLAPGTIEVWQDGQCIGRITNIGQPPHVALQEAAKTLAYDACQERRAMEEQLSASQAREREAVDKLERWAEWDREHPMGEVGLENPDAMVENLATLTPKDLAPPKFLVLRKKQKRECVARMESTLTGARKALEEKEDTFLTRLAEAMEKQPMGNGYDRNDWLDEFRAALAPEQKGE